MLNREAGRGRFTQASTRAPAPPTDCRSVCHPAGTRSATASTPGVTPSATSASTVGPAPEITAGTPRDRSVVDQRDRLRHRRLALLLVQEVLRRSQQLTRLSTERDHEQCGAPGVGDGVLVGHELGEQATGDLGAHAVRRHQHDPEDRVVHRRVLGPDHVAGLPGDDEPPEQRRCHVVRVSLEPVGQRQRLRVVQQRGPVGHQTPRQHDPADDRGRGRTQSTAVGDPVGAGQAQAGRLLPHRLEGRPHRAYDEMGLVAPEVLALPFDVHLEPAVDDLADDRVGQLERQPEAVETGSEVGAGRGHLHGDRAGDERHVRPARPLRPRPPRRRRRRCPPGR